MSGLTASNWDARQHKAFHEYGFFELKDPVNNRYSLAQACYKMPPEGRGNAASQGTSAPRLEARLVNVASPKRSRVNDDG